AFTLGAPPDGGGGTFNVEVAVTAADKFDLKVTWLKTLANKTLLDHAAAFQYIVSISKPPGGYGVPQEATITLSDGDDPGTVPMPVIQFFLNGGSDLYVVGLEAIVKNGGGTATAYKDVTPALNATINTNGGKALVFKPREPTDLVEMKVQLTNLKQTATPGPF